MVGAGTSEPMYEQMAGFFYRYKRNHPEMPLYIEVDTYECLLRMYDGRKYKRGIEAGCSGIKAAELLRESVCPSQIKELWQGIVEFVKRARKERCWNLVAVINGHEVELARGD